VAASRRLVEEAPADLHRIFKSSLDAAVEHRDIIARFGRFPHRNRALGRESTPEELAWLADQGKRFEQQNN
jgi:uncharacterized protein (DUF924 family)